MNSLLAEKLLAKQILKLDTEVDAIYRGTDLSGTNNVKAIGTFTITKLGRNKNQNIVLELASVVDGNKKIVPIESILKIYGMDPELLAKAFDIKPDGTDCTDAEIGKKRGRKPKEKLNDGQYNQHSGQSINETQKRTRRKGPNHRKFAA